VNKEDIMAKVEQAMVAHARATRKGPVDANYKAALLQAVEAIGEEWDFLKDYGPPHTLECFFVHYLSLPALLAANESYIAILEGKK